jgi:hypothetical protein
MNTCVQCFDAFIGSEILRFLWCAGHAVPEFERSSGRHVEEYPPENPLHAEMEFQGVELWSSPRYTRALRAPILVFVAYTHLTGHIAVIALVDVTGADAAGTSAHLQRDDDVSKLIKDLNKLAAGDLEEVRMGQLCGSL